MEDVASWDSRGDVAVERHAGSLKIRERNDWPAMTCNRDDFIEVCLIGDIPLSDIKTVRMRTATTDRATRLRLAELRGGTLGPRSKALVEAVKATQNWQTKYGTQTEQIR